MFIIRILLSLYCIRVMREYYTDKVHQLKKIKEEEQELSQTTKQARKLNAECLSIKDNNFFKWAYQTYIKDTEQEEKADCFIAWAGMYITDFPKRRTCLMQRQYCKGVEDVRHVLLKLRYNKIRDDWGSKLKKK